MHYYRFNIGDYRRKTGHLSLLEHGIYRVLIDTYYLNESSLVADDANLMRLHSIRTEDEKKAFKNVIEDFFIVEDGCYFHKVCEGEIGRYHEKSEKARKSAEARWGKPKEKQEDASQNANALQTDSEGNANDMRTPCESDANHLTNNHKPITNKKTYSENSDEFRIANFLYKNILKNKKDFKKPNLQKWADDAEKMLRIDKRNLETSKSLIAWVQKDSFEQTNVLSISKLRKRFDNLEMKMNKPEININKPEKSLEELIAEDENSDFDIELTDFEEVDND